MSISAAIITDFETEAAKTRKVLAAVPADRFDWKPHDKSMSLGQLASHVAENPLWGTSMMAAELDFEEVEKDYTPFAAESTEELLTAFDDYAAAFTKAIDGQSDEHMTAEWTMRKGDTVLMKSPRKDAVRETIIHHAIHHRGQLTVYLRLLEVPVPGTYGPTADDASF